MIDLVLAPARGSKENGAALLIVLAFIVLLTTITVAYVARTASDREVAHGNFNDAKSDLLARSALAVIVGDLKQEIVNGSTISTIGGATIYAPTSTPNIVPKCSPIPTPGTTPAIPNLLRRSTRSDAISLPALASRASAVNSAADVSLNGRSVSLARWNRHYLIPKSNPGDNSSNPVTTGFVAPNYWAPDWVFVTNNGPAVIVSPSTTVLGRYAYGIYDEGGLVDTNIAALPSPTPALNDIGRKGNLAMADLTAMQLTQAGATPDPTTISKIVGWRNYATLQSAGTFPTLSPTQNPSAFVSYFRDPFRDFTRVATTTYNNRTDQNFVTRQQLINLITAISGSLSMLQFSGTFSRELNMPSWSPASPDSINPDSRTLRVAGSFTRNDGTIATSGEPLLNKRFLLQRLNWLTYKGPSATRTIPPASPIPSTSDPDYDTWDLVNTYGLTSTFLAQGTDANILKYFGLVWQDSINQPDPSQRERWNYVGHNGGNSPIGSIATFGVGGTQAATRELDFFELLQAGILNGSLGDSLTSIFPISHQQSKMLQVLTVGANLISQATVDSYPTRIGCSVSGNTMEAVGSERLPYLNMLAACPVGSSLTTGGVSWFLIPNLWDPFRNTSGLAALPLRPTVQITVNGTVSFGAVSGGTTTPVSTTVPSPTATPMSAWLLSGSSTGGRDGLSAGNPESAKLDLGDLPAPAVSPTPSTFNAYPYSSENSNGNVASMAWRTTNPLSGANRYVVMRAGHPGSAIAASILGKNPALILNAGFQVTMDYQSPTNSSKWYSYSFLQGNSDSSTAMAQTQLVDTNSVYSTVSVTPDPTATPYPTQTIATAADTTQITPWAMATVNVASTFIKSDPRSTRFNSVIDRLADATASPTPVAAVVNSIWPTGAAPQTLGSGASNPAVYAQNTNAYTDTDGQRRLGDNGPNSSNPYRTTTNLSSPWGDPVRPLILNRPFRSVAEMGYAFRDQPFKTLDLLTTNSADAGLLDLFCVSENTNPSRLRAGVVNLNTRQAASLAALVSGVMRMDDSTTSSSVVNATDANTLATNLVTRTNTTPLTNRADLVSALANDSTLELTKTRHEAIIRALADSGQTRTWNLMIDVIAQSGHYPSSATSLSQFVVEGEKRYWLHVAIDRFTGEVIDQQLEAVYE